MMITILFLAANPSDTARLRLDEEIRTIDERLRRSEFRNMFELNQHWAVRVADIQELLLRYRPHIVHFSGHGSEAGRIILEDSTGSSRLVSVRALGQLFSTLKDNIRCVVLNACYSEEQALAIAEHVDCVIGMSGAITDSSATGFAASFYQALGYGRSIKTAFELGCGQIEMEELGQHDTPTLLALRSDPSKIAFAPSRGAKTVSDTTPPQLVTDTLQACASQVDTEIVSMVGKKYIPELYIKREMQAKLEVLIQPERYLQDILSELAELRLNYQTEFNFDNSGSEGKLGVLKNLMGFLRSLEKSSFPSGSLLRRFLNTLPEELNGRLLVFTGCAGTGKTNLLCNLAKHYVKKQPTIFLTGRSGITERTSIQEIIESKLGRYSEGGLLREQLFNQILSVAERLDTNLLIFLDAMNEHRDLDVLNVAMTHLLLEIRGKPVVVIASCRDIYWPFFDTSMWPKHQWSQLNSDIGLFSSIEFERAVNAYFAHYHISATISSEAKKKLAHPLILRFFCEAYGDSEVATGFVELPEIHDVRLKVLFDDYLAKKVESIRYTATRRRRTSRDIEDFLFSLADSMRRKQSREVSRDDVPVVTGLADLESPESVYVAILGEDIVLEEKPEGGTHHINVAFTFDEFMEYMIAQSMIRGRPLLDEVKVKSLIRECQTNVHAFPSFVGVFEYLNIILREDHDLGVWDIADFELLEFGMAVPRAIAKLRPEFLGEPELRTLRAMILLPTRKLRQSAVTCLKIIVGGRQYEKRWRRIGVEIIKEVLMQDDDPWIRVNAVRCFEENEVTSLSETARNIVAWWRYMKKDARRKTILLSEDDVDTTALMRSYFEAIGFERFYCVAWAYETIQLAEQIKPSLIISDSRKPDMSGDGMARAIKAIPSLAEIPLLSCAVNPTQSELFCAAISKPFALRELRTIVEMILAGKYQE